MIRIASFDIETTSLNADFGIVLCAVIKPSDVKADAPIIVRGDVENKQWDSERSNDRATVDRIVKELDPFDILIAHNGVRFDLPFLRTRIAKHGLQPLRNFKIIDPVQVARLKLRMSGNSLERIADFLGVNTKTTVDGSMWLKAALDGDREAMGYIVEHCVEDVLMLEKIVDAVKGYSSAYNSLGSAF